jgi:hypothetical protein
VADFARERYCVEQIASALTLSGDVEYLDPKEVYGRETGIDVIMLGRGLRIGFQVTEYDGGEAVAALGKGKMRSDEKLLQRASRPTGVYGGWGSPFFETSFAARIAEKVNKARNYEFTEVDQIWLLVSAGLPDAPTATFVPYFHISADILNAATAPSLDESSYDGAFFHVIMGNALYEWDRKSQWQRRS